VKHWLLFPGLKLRRFATIPMGSTLPPNVATPGPSAPHFSATQGPSAATTSTVPPPERFCRLGIFNFFNLFKILNYKKGNDGCYDWLLMSMYFFKQL
jgi:hypothetical protein